MIDPSDDVTLPLPVATNTPIAMHFMSEHRLYRMVLMRDLFGDWVLMQSWSSRFSRLGGGQTTPVESAEAGLERMQHIAKIRENHGYRRVNSQI